MTTKGATILIAVFSSEKSIEKRWRSCEKKVGYLFDR